MFIKKFRVLTKRIKIESMTSKPVYGKKKE